MKRTIAFSMAFLILELSLRMGIAFHFCGNHLAQFKIVFGYGQATCGMEGHKNNCRTNCHNFSTTTLDNAQCCHDQFQKINSDVFYSPDKFALGLFDFSHATIQLDYIFVPQVFEFKNFVCYRPPPDLSSVHLPFIAVFRI